MMRKPLTKLVAAGVLLTTFSAPALAMPVEWTLNNVVFEDGSSLTGSFTFDGGTGVYDLSNTTLHCLGLCPEETITQDLRNFGDNNEVFIAHFYNSGTTQPPLVSVYLYMGEDLADPGTNVLSLLGEMFYHDGIASSPEVYLLPGATISSSVVPVPAAVWLFGSAIGVLGWVRSRKTV